MTPFVIAGDNFKFFVGDQNCTQEITEIIDITLPVHACVTGNNLQNIQNMRFSMSGEQDLLQQEWLPFSNANILALPPNISGKIYIYAQYGYDTGTVATVQDDIDIAILSIGKTDIAGKTLAVDDALDVYNIYHIIKSPDNLSQVAINSAGKTSQIIV
jgi:hypothetical protein